MNTGTASLQVILFLWCGAAY